MSYIGGLTEDEYNNLVETDNLDWECPKCGIEGSLVWDGVNKESYVKMAKEYTYEKIYADPIGNQPDCCKSCGGPYPSCMSSCKIFDK
jgi:hypothetical protein